MSDAPHLRRVVGLAFGVAVSIGAIIGAGIFRTPGTIAALVGSGPLILLLWAIGGLHAVLGANVVAELGAAVPRAGGVYVFARRAFGDTGGLIVGWSDWLLQVATIAAVSIAFGEFAAQLWPPLKPHASACAALIQLGLYAANLRNLKSSSRLQRVSSALKGALLLAFVAAVFVWLAPATHVAHPVVAPRAGGPALLVASVAAYQLVVGAYQGWNAPIYFSEESEHPGRVLPRALLFGAALVAVIFVLINAALLWATPMARLARVDLAAAPAMSRLAGSAGASALAVVALITVFSCLNATVLMAPRILYGLAGDGLFPAFAGRLNRHGQPAAGLALSALFSVALALTGSFETVFAMLGLFSVLTYAITDAALFRLRVSEPDLVRPFRAFGYPVLPLLVLVVDWGLAVAFVAADWRGGLVALALVALSLPLTLAWRRRQRSLRAVGT